MSKTKLCRTCRYGNEYELDKPCVVYRDDCPLYEKRGDAMTREEVIKGLEGYIPWADEYEVDIEVLTGALELLKQEPSGDLISRQAVLDILEKEGHKWGNDYRDWVDAIEEIKKLPPVKQQEPKTGRGLHLSQQFKDWQFIQEPKTGHWIAYEVQLPERTILNYRCSVCGRKLIGYNTKTLSEAPFCHCGAKMIEPQESEVRNDLR